MILFYPPYDPVGRYLLILFYKRLSDFPEVTQLASDGTGLETKFLTTYYYIKCTTAVSFKDLQQFLKFDLFKLYWTNGKISEKYPLPWINKFQEQFILYAPERLTCLDNHCDSHCPMQIFHALLHLQSSLSCCSVLFCPVHLCSLIPPKPCLLAVWHYPYLCNFCSSTCSWYGIPDIFPSSLGKLSHPSS